MPIGCRNSSSRISPGWMLGRVFMARLRVIQW
jgi:hypothetical protein